jgi:hypothetical protein
MSKIRKSSTEFTAKKPDGPAEQKPADPTPSTPEAEAPIDPAGRSRAYLVAMMIWALGFAFLMGLLFYESVTDFLGFLKRALGW